MNLIYDKLIELGFTVVKPGGTFYIFPKALEEIHRPSAKKQRNMILYLCPETTSRQRDSSGWLTT